LGVDRLYFTKEVTSGRIRKSIPVHFRQSTKINFIGLFDLFEFSLWKSLHLLLHRSSEGAAELVNSLVDEFDLALDKRTSFPENCFSKKQISKHLEVLCSEAAQEWRKYWLLGGDPFSPQVCVELTLEAWNSLYDAVTVVFPPFVGNDLRPVASAW